MAGPGSARVAGQVAAGCAQAPPRGRGRACMPAAAAAACSRTQPHSPRLPPPCPAVSMPVRQQSRSALRSWELSLTRCTCPALPCPAVSTFVLRYREGALCGAGGGCGAAAQGLHQPGRHPGAAPGLLVPVFAFLPLVRLRCIPRPAGGARPVQQWLLQLPAGSWPAGPDPSCHLPLPAAPQIIKKPGGTIKVRSEAACSSGRPAQLHSAAARQGGATGMHSDLRSGARCLARC